MAAENTFDFMTLSAYVDGELDAETRASVARRLESDPAMARQVGEIRALKSAVAGLAGGGVWREPVARAKRVTPRIHWGKLAAALALLLISSVFALTFVDRSATESQRLAGALVAAHDSFVGSPATGLIPASGRESEVFRRAGLILVLEEELAAGPAVHRGYSGVNGCRISVFELSDPGGTLAGFAPSSPDLLSASWKTDSRLTLIVARDMDPRRFDAIARILEDMAGSGFAPTFASAPIPHAACVG